MLTDAHMTAASTLLKSQFPKNKGLRPCINNPDSLKDRKVFSYEEYDEKCDYIQFIYTGSLHLITCIIPKGELKRLNFNGLNQYDDS